VEYGLAFHNATRYQIFRENCMKTTMLFVLGLSWFSFANASSLGEGAPGPSGRPDFDIGEREEKIRRLKQENCKRAIQLIRYNHDMVNSSEKILELSKRLAEVDGNAPLESEFYQRSAKAQQEAKESLESTYASAIRECTGL